jgi:hypothetical protein
MIELIISCDVDKQFVDFVGQVAFNSRAFGVGLMELSQIGPFSVKESLFLHFKSI